MNPIDEAVRDFRVAEEFIPSSGLTTDRPIEVQIDPKNAEKITKIKKIADKWYDERWDTDWDTLQGSLMKIYKLVNKK